MKISKRVRAAIVALAAALILVAMPVSAGKAPEKPAAAPVVKRGGSGILPVRCRVGRKYVVKYVHANRIPAGCWRIR